ncbi:MAG: tetratricopeptide repeat protein [Sphingobacteriaceae bacterium]|jgi:tetratricopeptide (TPR) repeat protein
MNSNFLRTIGAGLTVAVVLSGCDGLGKMLKKQKDIQYTITPSPIEMIGDSVQFSVNGKFNPKLFAKKVTLTLTPVVKYATGEKALKPVVLVGDKATGSGQKISYSTGGTFGYTSEKFGFENAMRNATVELRAVGTVKKKEKKFDPVKLTDGTLATSLLVRNDEKPMMGKDNFQKSYPANQTTHIYYLINQSNVRPGELKSDEMKNFNNFVTTNINSVWYKFNGISVSAYASPDGETDKNENLAKDRANSGSAAIMAEFKKNKNKDNTFGKTKEQYQVGTTKEDWEGFKSLMEASTMADKDLVLRVLTMYTDADQRRKEIKNLSKTYTELADNVLPKLRRSEITVMVDKISRTDDQIVALINTTPDSLSLEELLYGANLVNDVNAKVAIYQNAEKRFASDWRTSNNLGGAYLLQNKLTDAADAFKRAEKVANGAPEVYNNLGIIEAKNGNRPAAMALYKKAGGSAETKYNMGIINVRDGKYADAVSNFGDFKGHNKALAQLLAGNPGSVKETIDASNEKDMAYSFYLKAVSFARQNNSAEAIANLKTAIEKDGALKAYAKDDCEFLKLRADGGFTALVN